MGISPSSCSIIPASFPRKTSTNTCILWLPNGALSEFKSQDRELKDHDRAFELVRYEERFELSEEGLADLKRLSELAEERNVFLICQCGASEHCHVDLLLLIAKHRFKAKTGFLRVKYPRFEERLERGK